MAALVPMFADERTAARLMCMSAPVFRGLVRDGALPGPVMIGELERWSVEQLRDILSGKAARPPQDFEL